MTLEELDLYFKSDKSHWYSFDNQNIKVWLQDEVELFWMRIRQHKVLKGDLNFNHFIFPEFEAVRFEQKDILIKVLTDGEEEISEELLDDSSFWFKNKPVEFTTDASFVNSKFFGKVNFEKINFFGKVDFTGAVFQGNVSFQCAKFWQQSTFTECLFELHADFSEMICKKEALFYHSTFNSSSFYRVNFYANAIFFGSSFYSKLIIDEAIFYSICDFSRVEFYKEVSMVSTNFRGQSLFDATSIWCNLKNDKESIFAYGSFSGKIDISNTILPANFDFTKVDVSKFVFHEKQDFSNLIFNECTFGDEYRMKLLYSVSSKDEASFSEKFKRWFSISFYRNKEAQYRGLKRNFEQNRDWNLSGLAFRSEMEMKKRKLFLQAFSRFSFTKYLEFIIFFIYGLLSGYTQSILRPLFYLAIVVFLGYEIYLDTFPAEEALLMSLSYSIPFLDLAPSLSGLDSYTLRFYGGAQNILGLILLTFFVLALRKRFKQ